MNDKNNSLTFLIDATLSIEKVRVRTQVRKSHLTLQSRNDPETDALLERLLEIESFLDGRVASNLTTHPAYDWFSKVKGIGKENIGKVIGLIDIEKCNTISALWKFAGFSVENGQAPKRTKGDKLHYNSILRSMCWRLGNSLLRAKTEFYEYYLSQKDRYYQTYQNRGISIVPATALPKKNGKRYEPENLIAQGHVHNQARRKMIKLFLACLWLVWREAEGLPVTTPYAIGILGHDSFIDPWKMIDKARDSEKTREVERAISHKETRAEERAIN